jgi:hypothetical protein
LIVSSHLYLGLPCYLLVNGFHLNIFLAVLVSGKCIYRYVNLFCYKHRSLLHVSATYCGHLQGGVLWRKYYYIEGQSNLQISNVMRAMKLTWCTIYLQFIQLLYIYMCRAC